MQKLLLLLALSAFACKPQQTDEQPIPPSPTLPVQVWTTSADQSNLLSGRTLDFAAAEDTRYPTIQIDTTQKMQPIEGFGYTLTGGSAMLLYQMGATERTALLKELFGKDASSIGVSYLRLSIGASDLDAEVFSYDDRPASSPDPDLTHFSLAKDQEHLIPVLKEILAINPDIRFMATPWSAPAWMKTNESSIGGGLKPEYYGVYAQYFVRYLKSMHSEGINIEAITPQNEPQHGGNNPSMEMTAEEQADFVKNHLGPALQAAALTTKIIVWDHNCDHPDYPIAILDDPDANPFVYGSAFHMYAGDASALGTVHDAHPDKALYFTEQWTGKNGTFDGDLQWHIRNVVIGTLRNWSRVVLEWNLANDPDFGPHTPGGCTECRGAVTINGSSAVKNVSFYIIAQVAKFVPPGSVRVASNVPGSLHNVAFRTPEGKTVLLVLNEGTAAQSFNVQSGGRWVSVNLGGKTAGTLVF